MRADFRAMGADGSVPILIDAATAPAEGTRRSVNWFANGIPCSWWLIRFCLARIRMKRRTPRRTALGPLIDDARIADTHVLATHQGGGSKADAIDSPIRSTATEGVVCALFVMPPDQRLPNASIRTAVSAPTWRKSKVDSELQRPPSVGTVLPPPRGLRSRRSLKFVTLAGGPQTQEQIRDGVEGRTKVIRAALTALC